jgi:hypothetical protein
MSDVEGEHFGTTNKQSRQGTPYPAAAHRTAAPAPRRPGLRRFDMLNAVKLHVGILTAVESWECGRLPQMPNRETERQQDLAHLDNSSWSSSTIYILRPPESTNCTPSKMKLAVLSLLLFIAAVDGFMPFSRARAAFRQTSAINRYSKSEFRLASSNPDLFSGTSCYLCYALYYSHLTKFCQLHSHMHRRSL